MPSPAERTYPGVAWSEKQGFEEPVELASMDPLRRLVPHVVDCHTCPHKVPSVTVAKDRSAVVPAGPQRRRALLAVGALALAVYGAWLMWVASRPSLWGDEGFTAAMVQLPVGRILADLRHIDVNMGAYYLLVVPVERVAGNSELALRLVSVLAVTATIPLFARLVAPVSGRLPAAL